MAAAPSSSSAELVEALSADLACLARLAHLAKSFLSFFPKGVERRTLRAVKPIKRVVMSGRLRARATPRAPEPSPRV